MKRSILKKVFVCCVLTPALLAGVLLAIGRPSARSAESVPYRDPGSPAGGEGPDAPTVTPTRTPTRTPTTAPTVTPTPPCYVLDVKMTGVSDSRTDAKINASGVAKQASCIHDLVKNSINYWTPSSKTAHFETYNHDKFILGGSFSAYYGNKSHKWSDDYIISGLWTNLLKNSGLRNPLDLPATSPAELAARKALYEDNKKYISCGKNGWATGWDFAFRGRKLGGGNAVLGEVACLTGMVFLDSQCRMIPFGALNATQQAACLVNKLAVQYLGSTPISLIFEGEGNPMLSYKIVKFPLDPSTEAKYWEWRGSQAAPLLVYDPKHKGEITTAEQVFGVWALGGKSNPEDPKAMRTKWAHGFEALASLDANADERISGDELEPLGLWFDENEDAISQAGEVRPAREVGIEALFFKVEKAADNLGDLTVSIGYHRKINGTLSTGKAVDWHSRGHATAEGLLMGRVLGGDSALTTSESADARAEATPPESDWNEKTALQSIYSPAGLWRVILEPESPLEIKDRVGETILALNVSSPNFLEGYTFSEVGIAGMQDAARAIAFTYTTGEKNLNVDGTIALTFESTNEFARLENTATLGHDGTTMRGKTVAHLAGDQKLKYSWHAVKMFDPSDNGEAGQ